MSISRWLPLLARSTRPGLGVTHTSSSRARVARAAALSPSAAAKWETMIRRAASCSSGTLWTRREAHPRPGAPQTMHPRSPPPADTRSGLPPSGVSTSRSKRRPRGEPSSMDTHSRFIFSPEPDTAYSASQPVTWRRSSRSRTGRFHAASPRSSASIPTRKVRRSRGESLTGPAIFKVKETTGTACRTSSADCRRDRASRASRISVRVTSLAMAAPPSVSDGSRFAVPVWRQ